MDLTKYKEEIEGKALSEELRRFRELDAKAVRAKEEVFYKIKNRFPVFFSHFEKELEDGASGWLVTENRADDAYGLPGILVDDIIFAPYNSSGGYSYVIVASWKDRDPSEIYKVNQKNEAGLIEAIELAQNDNKVEGILEELKDKL